MSIANSLLLLLYTIDWWNKYVLHMIYIKKLLHQGQLLEIVGDEVLPQKKSVMDCYFGSNLQYL